MDAFDRRVKARFNRVEHVRSDLHPYQHTIYNFALENKFSLILVDMGLGKTVSMLTLIVDLLHEFVYDKTLVIGPMRVATQTWPNEIAEWEHTAMLNHSLIHIADDDARVLAAAKRGRADARAAGSSPAEVASAGNKAALECKERLRIAATRSSESLHIIPVNWVEWLVEYWGPRWPYRFVIIDESSGFKDHTTNRFKALAKVRNHPGLMERIHLLTATPAAETYMHLFAQMFLLAGDKVFGLYITHFRQRYFNQNIYTKKWALRPGADVDILEKVAPYAIVLKAKDHLNLKEPQIIRRPVRLSESQMELYRTLEREFVITLPDGTQIEAETAAALSAKLLQMASGVLYETYLEQDFETDDFKKIKKVHDIHDQKLEELDEIVEEAQGEPILVTYHWQASLARLKKRYPKAVVMDREGKCVNKWNAGKIPMLLMHPMSGGHGLNLQKGGHIMVIYDLFHSLELFLQLVGRLARQGQKHVVMVYMLTALGTIDEAVATALKAKEDAQDKMFATLRRLIKKYRAELARMQDDEL